MAADHAGLLGVAGWSVPSTAKYRSAVNRASMRLSQEALVGTSASSTLLARAHRPTRGS
jgi:hypothetical protein